MDSHKVIKKLDELRLLRGSLRRRLEAQNPVGLYGYKNKNVHIQGLIGKFSVEQIAKSAEWSYMYAYYVLNNKPFKLGEPAIAKSAYYSYLYALYVLNNNRFELGEPAIAKDAKWSYKYARLVLHKPFKLGEPAIAKDAQYSYYYAHDVLDNKPFKLGEPAIAKSGFSYLYAYDVLELPELEAKKWGKNYGQ